MKQEIVVVGAVALWLVPILLLLGFQLHWRLFRRGGRVMPLDRKEDE